MEPTTVPLSAEELTPEWLTAALRDAGAIEGDVSSVVATRIGIGSGYIAQVLRLQLKYEPAEGGPASIVAKLPAAGAELRRSWWAGYVNEWRFYRDLAGAIPLHTPRYLGGVGEESSGLAATLLEDLDGSTSPQQEAGATLPLAEAVIEALASLHSTFWQSDRPEGAAWLASDPSAAAAALAQYVHTGAPHLARYAEGDPAIPRGLIDLAPTIHEAVAEASLRLGVAPQTLIHGDMRPDNLLFLGDDAREFVVIDWQSVGWNAGAFDLAYFLGQSLDPALRREHERDLLARYLKRLADDGVSDYGEAALWRDYRLGLVVSLFSPVGWSAEIATAEALRDVEGPVGDSARDTVEHGLQLLRLLAVRNFAAVEETGALELL